MTPPTEQLSDLLPTTPDGREERLAELRRLFPDLFTNEGRLDPGELKRLVEPEAANETERYEFKWYGKAASKREAFTPTTATLVYDEARSVNPDQAGGNLIIEGENLEVLKLLLNAYREKVKCIYIDPPYNADADVIYTDNFAIKSTAYWELTGDTEDGLKLTSSPETRGRRHSDWLSMMQSRLLVSRQLLAEDGMIFCSIDEKEYGNLIRLFGETFGFENLVGSLVWKGATDNNPTRIATEHEYVICFAKNLERCATPWKNASDETKEIMLAKYREIAARSDAATETTISEFRKFVRENSETLQPLTHYTQIDERGLYTGSRKVHNPKPGGYFYDVLHEKTGQPCIAPANGYRFPRETMDRLLAENYIDEKEAAHLAFLDGEAERPIFDEVLLKNGFRLDWTRERRDDFPNNTVYRIDDGEREALVCLAWSERLHDSTLKRLRELSENADVPFFLCLERSLDTTAKWNLKHLLGKHLVAF